MPELIRTDDAHEEADSLLPWYATGELDPTERSLVENHLKSCARCQRQLRHEQRLIEELAALSPEVEAGWARLRDRIALPVPEPRRTRFAGRGIWQTVRRPAVAALLAAQLAFVVFAGGLMLSLQRPDYRALGSAQAPAAANVLVIFKPEITEEHMRAALTASGASLVGGPTSADAYLLHVQPAARDAALARLRSDRNVSLAQPIDSGVS